MSWSAEQYTKFEAERNRPIRDLLAQLPTDNIHTAADIGCGPGNSTELLQARYPHATVVGMDSSSNMVEAARKRLPNVQFDVDDVATWKHDGPFDLILANALLQWVPNHETVLPALIRKLTKGGKLAVQMPDNLEEPAHRLMRETARHGSWSEKLAPVAQNLRPSYTPEWYLTTLQNLTSELDVWRTTYYHPLSGGPSAVVEWFKGTGLRPYLDPLDESERAAFLTQYEASLQGAYATLKDGTVLLPFPDSSLLPRANK